MLDKLKSAVKRIKLKGAGQPGLPSMELSPLEKMELALEELEPNTVRESYAILGLFADTPSLNEVKHAYRRLIWEYHPDRVVNLPLDIRDKAYKRATKINGAYIYLKRRNLAK